MIFKEIDEKNFFGNACVCGRINFMIRGRSHF
mgnify:CR=1 FL=1